MDTRRVPQQEGNGGTPMRATAGCGGRVRGGPYAMRRNTWVKVQRGPAGRTAFFLRLRLRPGPVPARPGCGTCSTPRTMRVR
ncbi:hypothetical protein GCM10010377_37070 [Streptomyces viridiviolaceus]|nr:hypothetical protein GCM10010377_37070 [Streptomyces viridiviolaceus]